MWVLLQGSFYLQVQEQIHYASAVSVAVNAEVGSAIIFKSAAFIEVEHMGHTGSSELSKSLECWCGYSYYSVSTHCPSKKYTEYCSFWPMKHGFQFFHDFAVQ